MSKNTTEASKNFFETMLDSQKQMFDHVKASTEQFTNKVKGANAPFEVGNEFFQNWYNKQMEFYNKMSQKGFSLDPKNEEYQEMFNGWLGTQMDLFKNFINTYQNMSKDGMKTMLPFNQMNGMSGEWSNLYNTWTDTMNKTWSSMNNGITNNDIKDNFKSMMSNANNYMQFMEIWNNVIKGLQGKTFDMNQFSKMFNMDAYKSMMDQMFHMMPSGVQDMTNQSKDWFQQMNKNFSEMGKSAWSNISSQWNNVYSSQTGNDMLNNWLNNYNQMFEMMQNASTPLAKMMTPNPMSKMMEDSSKINNMMVHYGVKNTQMQSHIYNTGLKAAQKVAETWASKMQAGEKFDNPMALYSEWLNINDKAFVELFETEEYSKLQSELSALGMKLKKEVDLQMEKALSNTPIITRSEMDELYQTIYDLKKRLRDLEKSNDTVVETPVSKANTKKGK